ncbi:hypothetical protein BGX33_001491 [Mortierella sp. NVP41]|nr:hypothetical protein BGX33_001491 [Mortierella sp. NVP41]
MSSIHFAATPRKPIDIGDGLVMRWSTKADTKNVEELVSDAFKWMSFGGPPPEPGVIPGPNKYLKDAARRMLSGKNAVMSEFDYALVEDTKRAPGKNPIVACLALHRVRAYYGCVDDLFFGRPDVIATDPEYRNRGLVRKLLFEMIHPESEARGDALQFIGGLKHFYRQFGYEYAMCSYSAATINDTRSISALEEGKTEEPYVLREATEDDIPFLLRLSAKEKASPHTSVGLLYGPEYWQFTLRGFFEVMENEWDEARDTRIIVDAATGKDVGFAIVAHPFNNKVEAIVIDETEARWYEVLLPVLRGIVTIEKGYLAEVKVKLEDTEPKIAQAINTESFVLSLMFHHDHPATRLLDTLLTPAPDCPEIRLYVRINDYPQFIRKVTPELERRLADSSLARFSGKLQLHFFRKVEGNKAKGLEIKFLKGKLVEVKDWVKPSPEEEVAEYLEVKARGEETPMIYEASFAPLTFHCLLTGERSLQDLIWSHGETSYKNDATKVLINTLFPKGSQHFDMFYF